MGRAVAWFEFPIHVESARCLAVQSVHSTCRLCQETCPTHAIRLDGQVELDEKACTGCGLCLAVCPTGVFTGIPWPVLLARAVRQSHEGHLSLGCAYTTASAAVILPCLGLLDDDLLLSLAALGVTGLTLHSADCATCPVGAERLIETHLARAQERWPDALDVTRERTAARKSVNLRSALEAAASRLETPVDRRGFFKLLGAQMGQAVGDKLPSLLPQEQPPAQEIPVELPERRRVLLQALGTRTLAFPRYSIGPACDDCQDAEPLCVRFCPSGALRREPLEGGARFILRPEHCMDCGQCAAICPQKAIRRDGLKTGAGEQVVRTFQAVRCQNCGRETTAAVDGLCPACRRHSDLQETLTRWLYHHGETGD